MHRHAIAQSSADTQAVSVGVPIKRRRIEYPAADPRDPEIRYLGKRRHSGSMRLYQRTLPANGDDGPAGDPEQRVLEHRQDRPEQALERPLLSGRSVRSTRTYGISN